MTDTTTKYIYDMEIELHYLEKNIAAVKRKLIYIPLLTFYAGGSVGSWLAITWSGFSEFPFREVGALLWPLLVTQWMGVS